MSHRPTFSVCIVTYNHERYIRDCILSVLYQDIPGGLEILVGEDGSTDGTRAILQDLDARFPGRLTLLLRDKNMGPFDNLRDLVVRARGEFIAHLDGDDYWMPGKLTAQTAFLARHPDCAAAYTNAHVIDDGGALKGGFNNAQPEVFDTNYLLEKGNFLNHSSVVYRAGFKDAVTGLPASFIDYRLHLRLSCRGALGYVDKDLVAYRLGATTSMMTGQSDRVQALYWEAIADPMLNGVPTRIRRQAVARGIAQFALSAMIAGRLPKGLAPARNSGALGRANPVFVLFSAAIVAIGLSAKILRTQIVKLMAHNRLRVFYDRK